MTEKKPAEGNGKVGDTVWLRSQDDEIKDLFGEWNKNLVVVKTGVKNIHGYLMDLRCKQGRGVYCVVNPHDREKILILPPSKELDTVLKLMLSTYSNLIAIRYPTNSDKLDYELFCTKCNETLTIEQSYSECSDLRYNPSQGFWQGKPCVSDGSDSVRCGCGTEYEAVEEWAPYQ